MLIAEAGRRVSCAGTRTKPEPFSRLPSDAEATEELLSIYQRAVRRHLMSDVPVGLLLSGGVDSGLLLGSDDRRGEQMADVHYWIRVELSRTMS